MGSLSRTRRVKADAKGRGVPSRRRTALARGSGITGSSSSPETGEFDEQQIFGRRPKAA